MFGYLVAASAATVFSDVTSNCAIFDWGMHFQQLGSPTVQSSRNPQVRQSNMSAIQPCTKSAVDFIDPPTFRFIERPSDRSTDRFTNSSSVSLIKWLTDGLTLWSSDVQARPSQTRQARFLAHSVAEWFTDWPMDVRWKWRCPARPLEMEVEYL